ncbi:MAG: hypothetical protein RLP02_13220 [Coleofasciculus sp. C2-GNP5-27]
MNVSERSLGIKKPLLSPQPLGQIPIKSHALGIFANSDVPHLDILSSTGRTVLAAISQPREEEPVRWAENTQANDGIELRNETQPTKLTGVPGEAPTVMADQQKTPIQSGRLEENLERIDENDQLEIRPIENRDENKLSTPFLPEVSQAKSFPQLPLSWQDLNIIISLGQFQGLGRSSLQSLQVLNLTPETSKTTPTSWSSLAELIGEDSPASSQDRHDEEIEGFMFTPDGFRPLYASPRKKLADVADSIEAESKTASGTNQTPIEMIQPSVTVAKSSQSSEPELVSESNLRMLAQEVYKLVRQRLQIERERYRR